MVNEQCFKPYILAALVLCCVFASGQYPDTVWIRIHSISPGGDIDEGRCVRRTDDGGYIITGSCVPDGMNSYTDLLLLKTDSLGYMQWVRTYGIEFGDEGLSVLQTFGGGYAVAGRALFLTGPTPPEHQSEIWLLRTDQNGDTIWTQTYGGSGHDYCTWIEQTPDSGFVMTGTMNAGRSYPPTCFLEYTPSATECAFLMKTNAQGGIVWSKTYHAGTYGNCVQPTADGGYVITGMIVTSAQPDIYLVRTNASGDTLWTRTIGHADSLEFGRAVLALQDGFIIAGHIGPMPLAGVDGLLVRTDLSGNVLWSNSHGDSLSDVMNAIEIAPDGGFLMVGNTNCMMHVHNGNIWVLRSDPQGNMLWQRTYDLAAADYAWSCTSTEDQGYVLTGLLGYGFGGDLLLAKIGTDTGIEDDPAQAVRTLAIENHPNPFCGSTRISYALFRPGFISLEIYDAAGKKVHTLVAEFQNEGVHSFNFDAPALPCGVYFVRLSRNGSPVATHRILSVR